MKTELKSNNGYETIAKAMKECKYGSLSFVWSKVLSIKDTHGISIYDQASLTLRKVTYLVFG